MNACAYICTCIRTHECSHCSTIAAYVRLSHGKHHAVSPAPPQMCTMLVSTLTSPACIGQACSVGAHRAFEHHQLGCPSTGAKSQDTSTCTWGGRQVQDTIEHRYRPRVASAAASWHSQQTRSSHNTTPHHTTPHHTTPNYIGI